MLLCSWPKGTSCQSEKPVLWGRVTAGQFEDLEPDLHPNIAAAGVTSAVSLRQCHVHVAVSSRTPVYRMKHIKLRDELVSLCCLHLPKKCQCWLRRMGRSKEWWCLSFSPHSAEAAGCNFCVLNNCTDSKQGKWSICDPGHFCSTGEAMLAHGHV